MKYRLLSRYAIIISCNLPVLHYNFISARGIVSGLSVLQDYLELFYFASIFNSVSITLSYQLISSSFSVPEP
jgi:hypothetical protein